MKKITFIFLFWNALFFSQFSIKINSPVAFNANEAYLYSLNGSKDILVDKITKKDNGWLFKVKNPYKGMMKIYFPDANTSLSFIAQNNKDVNLSFITKGNKISQIDYLDPMNKLFFEIQDQQKKKEQILPALYQIQNYYKETSDFGKALKNEVEYLNQNIIYNTSENDFIKYYFDNYSKFLSESADKKAPNNDNIIDFLNTSNNFLETSSLLKPILISFLGNTTKNDIAKDVDKLLTKVNIETPRGQTILSELIEIFDVYSITDLKDKYLEEAKNLKCTINERLSTTININKNTEIGAVIPNSKFLKATNTTAKTLHDVKANKKILVFWSSTCSHCEKEIPEILTKYNTLKSNNIEIIGLSLDSDSNSYEEKVKLLPWINDSEIRGWYSSYVDKYNIHATPTFYVLDANNKIIAKPDNFSQVLEFLGIK